MLSSVKMEVRDGLLRFPEQLKDQFLQTGDLPLWDGRRVSPAQMWYFLTEEAPRSFPAFYASKHNMIMGPSLPFHVELLSQLKLYYLRLTQRSCAEAKRKAGWALTLVNGGPLLDLYFGAHVIPMRPGSMSSLMLMESAEGQGATDLSATLEGIIDDGASRTCSDVCRQIRTHSGIRRRLVSVDLLAPYTAMRCSDIAYLVEWQRAGRMDLPKRLIDYPWDHDPSKPWKVKYVAQSQRETVKMIDQLTGRHTTDEDLRAAIIQMNRLRKACRELLRLWRAAPLPPVSSQLLNECENKAHDACQGADPVALARVFLEMHDETKEMVAHGVRGITVSPHPARLWMSGSCASPQATAVERSGGVVLGRDDRWGSLLANVDEDGDPYDNIARAVMSNPYEQPAEKRALWLVEEARQTRANGIIFAFQWGCNYQAAISRLMCDVAKTVGMPAINLEMDSLGRASTSEQINNRVTAFIEMLGGVAVSG